jgi:predicted nucleic acid-binding protein
VLVVADTSPINYLVQIGEVRLLPALYGPVTVPQAVARELGATAAPAAVREWAAAPPPWIHLHADPSTVPAGLTDLQAGEVAAIGVALELHADLVLLDDLDAREQARNLGLAVIATPGILDEAAGRRSLDFGSALDQLLGTTFRGTG